MESKYHYIRASGIRQAAKGEGKQVCEEFLAALDRQIYQIILRACRANGTVKRLSASVIE